MNVQPLHRRDLAYDAYVMRGRAVFAALFPDGKFDASTWQMQSLAATTAAKTQTIYFTRHGSTIDELPTLFSEPVKSWIVTSGGTAGRMHARAYAARWLWRGVEQRLGTDAASTFAWSDLRHADLLATEQLMIDTGLGARTINKAVTTMADCVRSLLLGGVAPAITYTSISPRPRDSNNHRVDDPEARGANVLSAAAVSAIADVFHRAVKTRDRLNSALMALLIAAGLRWNELVTLPIDPLEDQEIETRDVTGASVRIRVTFIRRHKAKSKRGGGGGRPNLELEPLTPQQAELAAMAVSSLTDICAESRRLALRLETTAPRWEWPFPIRPDHIRVREIMSIVGVGDTQATQILRQIGEVDPEAPSVGTGVIRRTTVAALEQYLTDRQDWSWLVVVKPTAGRSGQRASESLLCTRVNEVRESKGTLPLIGRPTIAAFAAWLDGIPGESLSVFERFEKEYGVRYREPDGSIVRITSHMCRRLFVTTGLTAGATIVDMARWQGREHIGDLSAYDQRSMAEKVALVKDAIMTGRLRGQIAQAYVALAEDVRDVWLEGQVHAVHVTPLGLCVHDFSATPCPFHLNCLKGDGCAEYLHDAADEGQVQMLVQLKRRTQVTMEEMQPAIERGQIAEAWLHEQQTTLRNIERTLDAGASAEGSVVQPFADGASRFQPLAFHE
jgi:hypothetical protein